MNVNPVLSEIQGLSPAAQAALGMAGHPTPQAMNAPVITPQMKAQIAAPDDIPAPAMSPMHMDSPAPTLNAPSQPNVSGPIRGTLQGDQLERKRLLDTGSGESQISNRIQGALSNHPLLGKILGGATQGLATLGDVGLSAVAPEIATNLPGTEYHHRALLNEAGKQVSQDTTNDQKEAQASSENATAGKTNAETPEVVPEAQAHIGAENATASIAPSEIAKNNAQTAALLHPQAKTDFEAWEAQNPGKPIEDWLKLQSQNKTIAPEQQYLTEYATKHPGSTVADAERQYMLDTQRPTQAAPVNLFVPGSQPGTETLQTVRPGQTVAAGAQTAAGLNSVNTPTTQQRTAAGRAETVVAMAPEVLSRIDSLAPKLGPLEGRWNEFMQGKVGSDDPDFAALRSDLLMMSSAVALAHAQGRLPENLRLEFDNAINAPHQTPENLKATINTMLPWLQKMQQQGKPNNPSSGGGRQMIRALDPQGVLHEAPAGTTLPAGWKAQ